jgi:hypothetical protein
MVLDQRLLGNFLKRVPVDLSREASKEGNFESQV